MSTTRRRRSRPRSTSYRRTWNDSRRTFARKGLVEPAQIVEASILIARDPELRAAVDQEVASGIAPQAAMIRAAEHFAQILAGLDNPLLAARAADVRAVGHRLAAAVVGERPHRSARRPRQGFRWRR